MGGPQHVNVWETEGLHTMARPQGDCVYCPGPETEHPTPPLSLEHRNESMTTSCAEAFLTLKYQLNAGLTRLVPVINSVVAERLAAEKVVTLKMTAHRFQEAQHKGSAGG